MSTTVERRARRILARDGLLLVRRGATYSVERRVVVASVVALNDVTSGRWSLHHHHKEGKTHHA